MTIRYALKSKCSHTNICYGCIVIERNTEGEIEEEMLELGNIRRSSNEPITV